ncbi:MAG: glutamate racemase [Dehalococcoidia bacterium]
MTDPRPIGFFDSGIGGVSVLSEVTRLLPGEDLVYYADSANFPYGPRSAGEIQQLACRATDVLVGRGAKLVVVACNTASTMALASLRAAYDLPFVGMVPAVKPASSLSKKRRVGVLATEGTAQTEVLADLIEEFARGSVVSTVAAPGLAALVERGVSEAEVRPLLNEFLQPLLEEGCDVIVLGCTHYFFLRPLIESLVPAGTTVVDSAEPVARRVRQLLTDSDLLNENAEEGRVEYLSSGNSSELARVLDHWRRAGNSIP